MQIDFLPMAIGSGALVDSQAAYAGAGYQVNGFPPGITLPSEFNKGFRQGTVMAAVVANFIANVLNENVLDNGNMATLIAQFTSAVESVAGGAAAPHIIAVAGSAIPALNCSAGNSLFADFEVQLNQNASPTISGAVPGQLVSITWFQNAPGGYTVTPPASLIGMGDPSTIPSGGQGAQLFRVGSDGNLHAVGPLVIA